MRAVMTNGPDFNNKLKSLETTTNKIEHFKKSTLAPVAINNALNIEDYNSDYKIKLWLNPEDKTAYYYAEPEKVYLNTDSSKMFYSGDYEQKIKNILELDLSNFDTSNVTDMQYMFYLMPSLTTLNLSSFNTSKVTDMNHMFIGMRNLTSLNLSNFDTSNVTDMQYMFFNMPSLTILDLSSFNTSKVTDMNHMFWGMRNLTTLNLSNFDTSQVTDMNSMFFDMSNLTTLDLSNFDTSKVTDMNFMFFLDNNYIPEDKLETIYVNNDFNTTKLTDYTMMFNNRRKLRGGNGSYLAYPYNVDKSWLRIDDPVHGRPGYFTRKS